jgi:hypothetical protein
MGWLAGIRSSLGASGHSRQHKFSPHAPQPKILLTFITISNIIALGNIRREDYCCKGGYAMFELVEVEALAQPRQYRTINGVLEVYLTCPNCGISGWFGHPAKTRKYCSRDCGLEAIRKRQFLASQALALSEETLRFESDKVAARDLRSRGWFVFYPIGQLAPCDLIVLNREHRAIRVEAKRARMGVKGKPVVNTTFNSDAFDLVAYILEDDSIVYDPPLESVGL